MKEKQDCVNSFLSRAPVIANVERQKITLNPYGNARFQSLLFFIIHHSTFIIKF